MKLYIKSLLPAAALALSLGLSSCVGDLNVKPIDPKTNMTVNPDNLFNKCYANMAVAGNGGANGDSDVDGIDGGTSGFLRQLFNSQELTSDEAISAWGDEGVQPLNKNQWNSEHPFLRGFYYRLFFGVTVCNHYLEVAKNYDATMTAEVRFLRALYYYYLMDGWGNIGFRTTVGSDKPAQMSRAELYKWIESEVLEAEKNMAEAKPEKDTEKGYGRADKAAAWLLLSRLYLNAEVYTGKPEWENAKKYAKMVMDSPYKLHTGKAVNGWTAYQQLFMGDNGSNGASDEAILALLQDGEKTTSYGTTLFLMAGAFNDDMNDGQFVSGNNTTGKWQGHRARPELVAKFFPEGEAPKDTTKAIQTAAGDDRALFWGKKRSLKISDPTKFVEGYGVTKFTNYRTDNAKTKNTLFPDADFFLMRAAEAYLTFGEADARLNGGTTTAEGTRVINQVRARAGASQLTSFSLNEILDEWSREFYFEGRRRTDLIRFDKFGGNNNYNWAWKSGVITGANFSKDMNLFPLPNTELNTNKNLKQNPGY